MAGKNEKEKSDTSPEDVLKPLNARETSFVEAEEALVQRDLRILEDKNGCLYINPDAQHIGSVKSNMDIIRIYSREIKALRKIVSLLMGLTINQLQFSPTDGVIAVSPSSFDTVINYLHNASWELALVNDRLFGSGPSGCSDRSVDRITKFC